MRPPVIVSDSTCYLSTELIERHSIRSVSLYVGLDGRRQRESDISDLGAFYDRLEASKEMVTTSEPSVGDFVAVYEPLLEAGHAIVSIHLSAEVSETFANARRAAEELTRSGKGGEHIRLIDSRSAGGGLGLVVLAAATAVADGCDIDDVVARGHKARDSVTVWFALDTLEYLKRGGRIGAAQALIGTTLRIKPILTMRGEVEPVVERVRGRERAFDRLVEYARECHRNGSDAWGIQHIQRPEEAGRLAEACRPIFNCDPISVSEIGPVIGAHSGPGLLGVGGLPLELVSQA